MRDEEVERIARRLAEEVASVRRASFVTADPAIRDRIVARVRANLAGRTIEETPD